MSGLFGSLSALVAAETRGQVDRLARIAGGYAIVAVGALGLAVTGAVSLHRWLSLRYDPFTADLAIAGMMLAVMLVGLVYVALVRRRAAREAAEREANARSTAATAAALSAAPAVLGLVRGAGSTTLIGLGVALILGALAGRAARGAQGDRGNEGP